MKRSTLGTLLFAAVLLLAAFAAVAAPPNQGRRGSGQPGPGFGPGHCLVMPGPDLTAVRTVTGTAVSLTGGPGRGTPILALTAEGEDLSLLLSPYRLWAASGLEIEAGQELTVTYAPCQKNDCLLIFSVTDEATGKTVQLRDPETGLPLGGAPGRGRW
ncbi:MAG TPA: hypothetical protein VLQ45_20660 [Thermoanaerobaculia bacterium]|nr:hypothetical protein [Thermoanaerobaculia bacterium]